MAHFYGRGSGLNPKNRFEDLVYREAVRERVKTKYIEVQAKTLINEVKSPDIPFRYSANPYQGCEHGCTYCYARPTHNYWGYSAGLEFESKILVKTNAVELYHQKLNSKNWKGETIQFSGNTDCYQPAERKYELTRKILKTSLEFSQSNGIITKSDLVLRDLDILGEMAKKRLISVAFSVNTLQDDLRHKLEPRATSIPKRLHAIEKLVDNGVPVQVLFAPIIPGLNSHEIFDLSERMASIGVYNIFYMVVRLNFDLGVIFENWLDNHFPDRKDKVMNGIRAFHGGEVSDSRFMTRMKGEGEEALMLNKQFKIAKSKFFPSPKVVELDTTIFASDINNQLSLF